MEKLKVCFIGCGMHSGRTIYPGLKNLSTMASLEAVSALKEWEVVASQERFGAKRTYLDYKEMVEKEKPQAVFIVGPPALHYQAGLHCLAKGIPIFVEKPPADTADQTREMIAAAKAGNTFAQVGFMMRHSAVVRRCRAIAEKDNLGPLTYGEFKYYTPGPRRSHKLVSEPKTDLAFLNMYLNVQMVHPINLACTFFSQPYLADADFIFQGDDLAARLTIRDRTNPQAMIAVIGQTFVGEGIMVFKTEQVYEKRGIICTEDFRRLQYYPPQPVAAYLDKAEAHAVTWEIPPFTNYLEKQGYQAEVEYFLNCVRDGRKPETGLEDALTTMDLIADTLKVCKQKLG